MEMSTEINHDPGLVMATYLHHSDPTIPHYRKEEWSFLRGAAATVDRPLMGWMGRFFLHNVRSGSRVSTVRSLTIIPGLT